MPDPDRSPPVEAGRMYYVHDRLHDPDQMVVAEKLVPCGRTELWIVREGRGRQFVCAESRLSDRPADAAYRALRDAASPA